jgi:hypothetical protein
MQLPSGYFFYRCPSWENLLRRRDDWEWAAVRSGAAASRLGATERLREVFVPHEQQWPK